jgi:predicted nucleic acid-binding protein
MERISSDNLLHLRELFMHWTPVFRLLELLPQFRLVIDANVVIEELIYLTQSRRNLSARTSLQEAVDAGAVAALAPLKLREEMSRKIPELAAKRGVSEEALQRAWLEYQSRIRFVEVEPASTAEAAAARDPNDLPYVYLYRKMNADAVLSSDKDIPAMGAESVELEVLIHVRNYARAKTVEITLKVGGLMVTAPVVAGLLALGKILSRMAKGFVRLPLEAQLALLVGALGLVAYPRSRKAVSAFISAQALKLKGPTWAVLDVVGALSEEWGAAQRRVQVEQEILERAIPRAARRPLWLVARSVCLESGRALTAEELMRGVVRAGYVSQSTQLKQYLLRVLRRHELFISTLDGRWTVRAYEDWPAIYQRS